MANSLSRMRSYISLWMKPAPFSSSARTAAKPAASTAGAMTLE